MAAKAQIFSAHLFLYTSPTPRTPAAASGNRWVGIGSIFTCSPTEQKLIRVSSLPWPYVAAIRSVA